MRRVSRRWLSPTWSECTNSMRQCIRTCRTHAVTALIRSSSMWHSLIKMPCRRSAKGTSGSRMPLLHAQRRERGAPVSPCMRMGCSCGRPPWRSAASMCRPTERCCSRSGLAPLHAQAWLGATAPPRMRALANAPKVADVDADYLALGDCLLVRKRPAQELRVQEG